jgi:hypothetical protein
MRERPLTLENAPLQYAPENELGVVYLFANVAKKFQLRIERIKPSFPDCIAYRRVGNSEKLVRIEFEYRSSNFHAHKHDARKCDCIVCWHHDWPDVPKNLEIIELKQLFGWAFQVWIQPAIKDQCHFLDDFDELEWALSKQTTPGDILLMYRCSPWKHISDVFVLTERLYRKKADWRKGDCYAGHIRRICSLKSPVYLEDIRNHEILKDAVFIKRNMQGNHLVTGYWHYLHDMILQRNPRLKRTLSKYAPEKM